MSSIFTKAKTGRVGPTNAFIDYRRVRKVENRVSPVARETVTIQSGRGKHHQEVEFQQPQPAPWSARTRPTHFLGLRVSPSSNLVKSYQSFESELSVMDASWPKLLIPAHRLHLTIGVCTLRDDSEIKRVSAVVDEAASCVKAMKIRFNGLSTFNDGRVLFARPAADEHCRALRDLSNAVRRELTRSGIDMKGNPHDEYVPHVTLAKVTPKIRKDFGLEKLPLRMYALAKDDEFGATWFQDLDLCNMNESQDDGYWKIVHRAALQ